MAEAAEKYVYINMPGAHVGLYDNKKSPNMIEPMNTFVSRQFQGLILVGPAQCGKTQSMIVNTVAYTIKVDPMDMIIFCPSNAAARDFSTRRIKRLHDDNPELRDLLRKESDSDNKFDKHYKTGVILTLSWPSKTELAGRPIGRVVLTDRDRMDDNIEGEGEPFDLAQKRTTTFRSFGMCVAESSPSRPITDLKWVRKTKHEAPPCAGILGLYNRGDRRRYYWPCPTCGSYFEGNFRMLEWSKKPNPVDASESVFMRCPANACVIAPGFRDQMLQAGVWLKDGEYITNDGVIGGMSERSKIASFWVNGVAAGFVTWPELVHGYIVANTHYERTGDEEPLIKFFNNDLAEPYVPKDMERMRLPEVLHARAEDLGGSLQDPVVPHGVRFLLATVDVQQNMFIVQVHGICPGMPFDIIIIDRFRIHLSDGRLDGDGQVEWVKPGTYLEDWDLITEKVLKRSYPLAGDEKGRRMTIKFTACDSGGKAGVTSNAYEYSRKLRGEGLGSRFVLLKGDPTPQAPRFRVHYPDSSNSKLKAAAQGDVPVLMLASNLLKDMADNRLDSLSPGKGMVRFPDWLPEWFYGELCAETRTDKGWMNPTRSRNEAWDLLYYCIGLAISGFVQAETLEWSAPPKWAADWDNNSLVVSDEKNQPFARPGESAYDFAALARKLT